MSKTNFVPPSEEIQRLFVFKQTDSRDNSPSLSADLESKGIFPADYEFDTRGGVKPALRYVYSFTENDFAKMPSTLMKAIKRMDEHSHLMELMRKYIIEGNNEAKNTQTLLVRYGRKTLKEQEKQDAIEETNIEKGKQKGFRRQCRISDDMCTFMGIESGSMSSRVDVNRAITDYIRANKLVDPDNAQRILPDETLWGLLSDNAKGNKITYFSIQKYIKHHFVKVAK